MAYALANSFAFQEGAQQLAALQAGTGREEQASQAKCTCWGRDVDCEVKPERKLRNEVLRGSRLSVLLHELWS